MASLGILGVSDPPQVLHTPTFNSIIGNPAIKVVRIPTIGDGNCLFHALLTAIDYRYNTLNYSQKVSYAAMIRKGVFESINEAWSTIGNEFKLGLLDLTKEDGTLDMVKATNYSYFLESEAATVIMNIFNMDVNTTLLLDSRINGGSDLNFISKIHNPSRYQIYIGGNTAHFETVAIWDGTRYLTVLKGDSPYHQALMKEASSRK